MDDPFKNPEILNAVRGINKKLVADGKLIETGFMAFKRFCVPPNASPEQYKAMRMAFFAGAQHLFGSMVMVLDPEAEPTEDDLKIMDSINTELAAFADEMKKAMPASLQGPPKQ